MNMNTAVPKLKYATFRLRFHCIYAWQSIITPSNGIEILFASFQMSNICSTDKTRTDRLTIIDITEITLCIKVLSFQFVFIFSYPLSLSTDYPIPQQINCD